MNPGNSSVQQDGGFFFPAWGIHVAADTLEEAKARIREDHGKDVDTDIPPTQPGLLPEKIEDQEGDANLSEESAHDDIRPEEL
jgi:hypothetical protein